MEYNPVRLAVLAVWVFAGIFVVKSLRKNKDPQIRESLPRLNFAALFLAPPVWLYAAGLKDVIQRICGGVKNVQNRWNRIDLDIIDGQGKAMFGDVFDSENEAVSGVKQMLYDAQSKRASDIFLDPKPDKTLAIRFRVDGGLRNIREINTALGENYVNVLKVAAGMDISEHRRPQDGSFSIHSSFGKVSMRVASVGAYGGEKIALRILGSDSGPRTLEESGIAGEDLRLLESSVRLPSGMILLCGPTGSGKTTTLYAMLHSIDYSLKNVVSIEDPIEHVVPNISQMEVNTKAEITFSKLLRNALRQNPDVICLGEIRDEDTAEVAVHAAQTGHLIIATIHSNDNLGTIDRLMNLGVPLRSLASTLRVIISQRLVRRLCKCKVQGEPTPEQRAMLSPFDLENGLFFVPGGCRECDGTGYAGRVALFDILVINNELREALESDRATLTSIKAQLERSSGGSRLVRQGCKLANRGITSLAEVERVTLDLERKKQ